MDVVFHTNCFDGTLSLSILTLMDLLYKPSSPEKPFSYFIGDELTSLPPVTVLDTVFPEEELKSLPVDVQGKLTPSMIKSMASERDSLWLSRQKGSPEEETVMNDSQKHRFFPLIVNDYQRPFERLIREESKETNRLLLIIDCSAGLNELKRLLSKYKLVVIIDHHLTLGRSIDGLLKAQLSNLRIVFSTTNSASFLMAKLFRMLLGDFWNFLDRKTSYDLLLKLICVNAKDTSATKDIDANALIEKAFALRLNQPEHRNYEGRVAFLSTSASTLIELGKPALKQRDNYVAEVVSRRIRVKLEVGEKFSGQKSTFYGFGIKGIKAVKHLSEVGNQLAVESAKRGDDGFGVVHKEGGNGTLYVSLRSEESLEFDCEAIARHFGGGGHRMAAGFTVPKSKFNALFSFLW